MKVLIVNQNALVSQAMRAILESHDFEVSLSAYALQARAEQPGIPAPGRPDVALVDIRVPDSGGIEAGRRIIRDLERRHRLDPIFNPGERGPGHGLRRRRVVGEGGGWIARVDGWGIDQIGRCEDAAGVE